MFLSSIANKNTYPSISNCQIPFLFFQTHISKWTFVAKIFEFIRVLKSLQLDAVYCNKTNKMGVSKNPNTLFDTVMPHFEIHFEGEPYHNGLKNVTDIRL